MLHPNDTPPRPSTVSMTNSAAPTKMADVAIAVNRDLHQSVVVSSGSFFLQTILQNHILNIKTKAVAEAVKKACYDTAGKRWKDFPVSDENENEFYPKFVALANSINETALPHRPSQNTVSGKWTDCHSKAPDANADFVAEIRPDCAFVSDEHAVDVAIKGFAAVKRPRADSNDEPAPETKVNKNSNIWWRQMVVVVEVKKKDQHPETLAQLCNYIRQVFKQQLDRRFCLGITISFKTIAMWLCDRSGTLGMSKTYHIHKEPDDFVRMICAVTYLPSYRLGWDPTLKLYNTATQRFEPSYVIRALRNPPAALTTTSRTTDYDISSSKWLLTLVDNQRKNKPVVRRIILAGNPLLIRTAEGMNGRAVQVHKGYREEDENKKRRRPLVVKSSWQPTMKIYENQSDGTYMSHEAYMYSLVSGFEGRLYAASIVEAGHGLDAVDRTPVTTLGYIRQNAEPDIEAGRQMNKEVQNFKPTTEISEAKETMAFLAFGGSKNSTADQMYFATELAKITDRVQTRIALNIWGWPLKFFTDLRELLAVIRDAVTDHQTMHRSRVLHRDVSMANVLIVPKPPDSTNSSLSLSELVSKPEGRLIDLDHAKHAKGLKDPRLDANAAPEIRINTICYVYNRNLADHALTLVSANEGLHYCDVAVASNVLGSETTKEVVISDSKSDGANANTPVVLDSKPNSANPTPPIVTEVRAKLESEWTPADLGWEDVGEVPDYASHTSTVNERTGTIPFISHKLIGDDDPPVHMPIHDLESFWWVIIYLCLTREAGGGHRRIDETKELTDFVDSLFNGANIGQVKSHYFGDRGKARFEKLLDHFSYYFNPLKPMLRTWREILMLGYTHKAYEYHLIHKYVLAAIDHQINNPTEGPNTEWVANAIEKEIGRREEEYAFICNIDRPTSTVEGPPPTGILVDPNGMSPPRPERNRQATPGPSNPRPNPQPPSTPTPAAQANKKARHNR